MPDGSSGLSLSEIGISSVKKTAQVVKKIATPVGSQVKQQLGGSFIPGVSPQLPSSQPPNESSPKQSGGFDIGSIFNEKNAYGKSNTTQTTGQQKQDPQLAAQLEEQKAKDKQQMEVLRKKLHEVYFEEFKRKAEGRDKKSEEEEKKKLEFESEEESKKREKEALMEPLQMSQGPQKGMPQMGKKKSSGFSFLKFIKPKQGSHEGRSGKG